MLSLLHAEVSVNWCSFNSTGLFIIGNKKYSAKRSTITFFGDDFEDSDSEDSDFEDEGDLYFEHEDDVEGEDEESDAEDSFCVWNAITLQRCDVRSLPERNLKNRKSFQNKLCKRCFQSGSEIPPTYKILDVEPYETLEFSQIPYVSWSTGFYNGVECFFALGEQSVSVVENIHFTTLAAWNLTVDGYYNAVVSNSYYKWKIFREITAIEDDLWLYGDVKKLIVFRTLESACPKRVLSCSFSPDGSRLATCTADGCINIWNVQTSEVEQGYKYGLGESPFACWWSKTFFFVFDFVDKIPQLSKYSVDVNLNIVFSISQQVPLYHLSDEFVSLSSVINFSEGFLCFECGEAKPVKILNVNGDNGAQMVILPGIEPKRIISVSPGASFVFGDKECREKNPMIDYDTNFSIFKRSPPMGYGIPDFVGGTFIGADENKYYIWKRNAKEPSGYELFHTQPGIPLPKNRGVISCFSNDSNVIVIAYRLLCRPRVHCEIIDLNTGNYKNILFDYSDPNSKLFCINDDKVVVAVAHQYITILGMNTGAFPNSNKTLPKWDSASFSQGKW